MNDRSLVQLSATTVLGEIAERVTFLLITLEQRHLCDKETQTSQDECGIIVEPNLVLQSDTQVLLTTFAERTLSKRKLAIKSYKPSVKPLIFNITMYPLKDPIIPAGSQTTLFSTTPSS